MSKKKPTEEDELFAMLFRFLCGGPVGVERALARFEKEEGGVIWASEKPPKPASPDSPRHHARSWGNLGPGCFSWPLAVV